MMSSLQATTNVTEEALERVAAASRLDTDELKKQVDAVLQDSLYWFPVRHHSPAVAIYLEQVINTRKPKVILIEGPHEANHLLQHLVDSQTKPPVAIYSSYRDDDNVLGLAGIASPASHIPPRFATWYPMVPYSPEYVAIQAAKRIGAQVVFMDLPHAALIKSAASSTDDDVTAVDEAAHDAEAVVAGPVTAPVVDPSVEPVLPAVQLDAEEKTAATEEKADGHQPHFNDDRLIIESEFYQTLAQVAGYRSWDEAWDSLFEVRKFKDVEEFRYELATFCAAARATAHPGRVSSDGTLERERFMLHTIKQTLMDKGIEPADAMVVCGGFHLFLNREDQLPPPPMPAGTVFATIVPYSYFRIWEKSGYASGNRAPQYYQTLWKFARDKQIDQTLVEHVVAVLTAARKLGEPVSSADAIAICHHAEMLARLRGRELPVLDDIHDALITCCCKGNPDDEGLQLQKAIGIADVGNAIGRVTSALGQLPIVKDYNMQLESLELNHLVVSEKRVKFDVDKRKGLQNRQSAFLHRLSYLKVPLASLLERPSSDFSDGKIFLERWLASWNPGVDASLIELNLYGDTVEIAAVSKLREDLASEQSDAGATCMRLVEAINMDLQNLVQEAEDACSKAIDSDTKFVSLCRGLNGLKLLERYATYKNVRQTVLDEITLRCFNRACFALLDVVAVPENEQNEVVSALLSLAEVLQRDKQNALDRTLFIQHAQHAADVSPVPFMRGVFLGILTELRELSPEDLAEEIFSLVRAGEEKMTTAGDLLNGIMSVSRTSIMLGADALIGAIDELLRAADGDCFLTMLPRLRAAMDCLHARQRDAIALRVAQRYGLAQSDTLTELRTSVGAAAKIAELDQAVAKIMKDWEFS